MRTYDIRKFQVVECFIVSKGIVRHALKDREEALRVCAHFNKIAGKSQLTVFYDVHPSEVTYIAPQIGYGPAEKAITAPQYACQKAPQRGPMYGGYVYNEATDEATSRPAEITMRYCTKLFEDVEISEECVYCTYKKCKHSLTYRETLTINNYQRMFGAGLKQANKVA